MSENNSKKRNDPCEIRDGALFYKGTPVRDMIFFPLGVAARIMGISSVTLWRELGMGRIKKMPLNLISRAEIERWRTEQEASKKRANRPRFAAA